jgi:hypothetical protein
MSEYVRNVYLRTPLAIRKKKKKEDHINSTMVIKLGDIKSGDIL